MAIDEDNNTKSNDTPQTQDNAQSWDTDIPVDENATNADVVEGTNKKKVAGIGIVVGLVILAVILVVTLKKSPTEPQPGTQPPTLVETPPPGLPDAPPAPGKPEAPKPEVPQTPPAANPNNVVDGSLSRPKEVHWVKGVKKPLPVPDGLTATPGLHGSNSPQVRVVQGNVGGSSSTSSHSIEAAMGQLWRNGAAAKHRGDYAAARKAWNRILELDPGHAGIQEAIDKLPQ